MHEAKKSSTPTRRRPLPSGTRSFARGPQCACMMGGVNVVVLVVLISAGAPVMDKQQSSRDLRGSIMQSTKSPLLCQIRSAADGHEGASCTATEHVYAACGFF